MDIKEADHRPRLDKNKYSVRTMQAVLQYGVGAMVDFKEQTLMTAAPEYWSDSIIKIYDERLQKALGVSYFGVPASEVNNFPKEGIAYARFPEWYFCPNCRRFKPIKDWVKEYKAIGNKKAVEDDPQMIKHMQCPKCKQNLVVARLVTVCEHGHIDDFPWIKWVHAKNFSGAKEVCKYPSLELRSGNSSSEGLESLHIICNSCGASATLKGAFGEENGNPFVITDKTTNGKFNFTCTGRHPWKNTAETCNLYPITKQRGSSSVYFPVTVSSLVIPPYSEKLNMKIESLQQYAESKSKLKTIKEFKDEGLFTDEQYITKKKSIIEEYSEKIAVVLQGISPEKIQSILNRKWADDGDDTEKIVDITQYKSEEYGALTGNIPGSSDDEGDFIRESTDIDDYYRSGISEIKIVKSVSLIKKIREVQALTGFSRINPVERDDFGNISRNVVSVKDRSTDWYPAYEVRGEGIFIEFDNAQIKKWMKNVPEAAQRAEKLQNRFDESYFGSQYNRKITAEFLLLHTISHLLIKELSFSCGYSIASIKERIYCSDEMSGVFIYTAGGDSECTLGGLVRQGRPDVFPKIFKKAIQSAEICSNDPVCNMSNGQGRDSLNLAACYSCTLIPETSCEEYNIFLDRVVIVGTYENRKLGFFSSDYSETSSQEEREQSNPDDNICKTELVVESDGIDWKDADYSTIWKSLPKDTETEKQLVNALIENSDSFNRKEKPMANGSFMLFGESLKQGYTLIWKKSKVIYFSSDYEEEYNFASASDWQCVFSDDDSVTYDKILELLKDV